MGTRIRKTRFRAAQLELWRARCVGWCSIARRRLHIAVHHCGGDVKATAALVSLQQAISFAAFDGAAVWEIAADTVVKAPRSR